MKVREHLALFFLDVVLYDSHQGSVCPAMSLREGAGLGHNEKDGAGDGFYPINGNLTERVVPFSEVCRSTEPPTCRARDSISFNPEPS
jgi:hypothetical protein